mmetsp:Transcript_74202/g.119750  ORF Transcript_74202/g.119750 Transcript_74202/m.119750 type:complete len:203 (+) Transcript_74202:567-1175(+)
MSPMAKMLGTLVRQWSSIKILLRSTFTPTASRPRLSKNVRRPTHTRTTSASAVLTSPPFAASVCTLMTPSAAFSTPVTFVFSSNFMPCFLSIAVNCLATSVSMPTPPIESMNSTTVTLLPSRAQTEPSSRPMTPPPITVRRSGTFSSFRAPVLETIVFSSSSMFGKLITSEPVASMMFLLSIVWSPPSMSATLTVLGPPKVP